MIQKNNNFLSVCKIVWLLIFNHTLTVAFQCLIIKHHVTLFLYYGYSLRAKKLELYKLK